MSEQTDPLGSMLPPDIPVWVVQDQYARGWFEIYTTKELADKRAGQLNEKCVNPRYQVHGDILRQRVI